MDHARYTRDIHAAVELFESGRLEEAAVAWRVLASDSELALPDRALQLQNLALTLTKLGRVDEAEAAYDEGIAIEQRLLRGYLLEAKAAWLVERGRSGDAVAIYEWLLRQFWLDSGQIQRYRQNLASLSGSG